jgi:hypothetical protein
MNVVDGSAAYTTAYNLAIANGKSAEAAVLAGNTAKTAARDYIIKPDYEAEIARLWKVWTTGDINNPVADPASYHFTPSTNTLTFVGDLQTYTPSATTWTTLTSYTAGDYVISGSLRYLCSISHVADVFATDLAAYRWQLVDNDLIVKAVLIPRVNCNELAAWFMEKWAEGIIAGAKSRLMVMKNKNWSSPERVAYFDNEYTRYVNLAIRERFTEDTSAGCTFTTPSFVR